MADGSDWNTGTGDKLMMYTLQDYDDEDLIVVLKDRGYAVYKNKEMERNIVRLESLQGHIKGKLAALEHLRGK